MENVDQLSADLGGLEDQSVITYKDLDTFYNNLDAVDVILEDVKKVDDDLQNLDSMLSAAHDALTIIQLIPTIRTEAKAMDDQVQLLSGPVHKARLNADKVEGNVKPWRKDLEEVEKAVDGVRSVVMMIKDSTPKADATLLSLEKCINGLPDSQVKTDLQQKLDAASKTVDPLVVSLTKLLHDLDTPVNAVNSVIADAINRFKSVGRLLGELNDVIGKLGPIMDPLKSLVSALDYKIGFKKFKFSIRQILQGIKLPWPFGYLVNKFEEAAMSYLKPFLNALHLNITLPGIPDLDALDGFDVAFGKIFDSISSDLATIGKLIDSLEALEKQLVDDIQLFNIKCPPQSGNI